MRYICIDIKSTVSVNCVSWIKPQKIPIEVCFGVSENCFRNKAGNKWHNNRNVNFSKLGPWKVKRQISRCGQRYDVSSLHLNTCKLHMNILYKKSSQNIKGDIFPQNGESIVVRWQADVKNEVIYYAWFRTGQSDTCVHGWFCVQIYVCSCWWPCESIVLIYVDGVDPGHSSLNNGVQGK